MASSVPNAPAAGFQLALPAEVLRPLVAAVVAETLARLDAARAALPDAGRLAYSESESARMLGLNVHQLRDERLRGRIAASKIVGGRIAYQKDDLIRYLADRRTPAGGEEEGRHAS